MKRIAKPLGAVLFGLIWALLIAEVGARILAARGAIPSRMPADLFAAHEIGWTMQPNLNATVPSLEGMIHVKTNDIGYRDERYPVARTPDRVRLLVLGDSYVAGIETPQEETFHARMEERYGGAVEVMTFAATGYSTQSEVLAFETIGRPYQPDIVLLMLYVGNDIMGNAPNSELPSYALEGGEMVLHNYPYTGEFELPLVAGNRSTPIMRLSQVTFLVGIVMQDQAQGGGPTEGTSPAPQAESEDLSTRYCDYELESSYPVPSEADWAITEALLTRLRDEVEADGGELLVAVIPTEFQIQPDHEAEFMQRCNQPDRTDWVPPQETLLPFLEANEFEYLDLREALTDARESTGMPMYYANIDNHWSPHGHAAVAEALYQWLGLP